MGRTTRSSSCRSNFLRVVIPPQYASISSSNSPLAPANSLQSSIAQNLTNTINSSATMNTSYYYGMGGSSSLSGGQLSPSCNSVSSVSSFDSNNSPNTLALATNNSSGTNVESAVTSESSTLTCRERSASSSFLLSVNTTQQQLLSTPIIHHPPQSHQSSLSSSKTIVIRKGPQGYGFTIQSVRVYLR